MNQSTAQRSSRVFCVLWAAILLLAAFPGKAANLVDVRIGLHQEYTRVVLETDARAPCWIEPSGSEELVLRLNASSGDRVVASKYSEQLVSVAVTPVGVGVSEIRIALRGPVETEKLVLSTPDRIVLDLRAAGEAGAAAPTDGHLAPTDGEPPLPTPAPEPVAEATPEPTDAPLASELDAPTEVLLEPVPAEPLEPVPAEPLEPVSAEPLEPGFEEVEESEEVVEVPAHPEPDPSAVLAAEEAEEPVPAFPESSTLTPRADLPPPAAAEGGLLDGLPTPLDQPLLLAGLAMALIFVIAFAVVRRRGAAEDEEPITPFAAGEPFSVDEQPGAAAPQEGVEEAFPVSPADATQESSLFDQPAETTEPSGEQQDAPPATDSEEVAATIPAAPPAPTADPSQGLERRLTQLEERLDEMVDAKDRLGRQIAAQTEELRVQRAAIARTQRVLRDLTRPGEEATEPIPKP